MAMRNFDVSFTRCCPCFLSLLTEALYNSKRKNDTSVLLSDYVSSRYEKTFAIETFIQSGTILFTCFQHLLQIFCFDFKLCYHYQKRSYFCVIYKEE